MSSRVSSPSPFPPRNPSGPSINMHTRTVPVPCSHKTNLVQDSPRGGVQDKLGPLAGWCKEVNRAVRGTERMRRSAC
jgi:hypothetical protein